MRGLVCGVVQAAGNLIALNNLLDLLLTERYVPF